MQIEGQQWTTTRESYSIYINQNIDGFRQNNLQGFRIH